MTKDTRSIQERLFDTMVELKYIQKQGSVNNQYSFAGHDKVTKVCREALLENRVITRPNIISRTQNGNRTEVDMEMEFINIDKPDDIHIVPSFGYGIDNQDKGPGKAISYACKYAYLKGLQLETGDKDVEDDNMEHEKETTFDTAKDRNDFYKLVIQTVQQATSHDQLNEIERRYNLRVDKLKESSEYYDSDEAMEAQINSEIEEMREALNVYDPLTGEPRVDE